MTRATPESEPRHHFEDLHGHREPGASPMKETHYRRYMLSVLLVILGFNYVDRLALGLVLQDIKTEFGLNDAQLGFLTGLAFAVFYSIMGLPIARWADRGNRVTIITLTTALWSAAVALCGAASTFAQLLLIRVGVAVGEAGCVPPAHSLMADYYNRAERPRAVAIYMMGASLSTVMGYFLAGWLNEIYGWRTTFAVLGLPGFALALIAWLTLREPRRANLTNLVSAAGVSRPHVEVPVQPSLKDASRILWANTTFRHLLFCFSVMAFFGYGILQWQPTFLIRSYGLQTGELGMWFAVIYGLGSVIGTYAGGELAARCAANNERLQLRVMALAYCSFSLISASIYLVSNRYLALGLMTLSAIGSAMSTGPLFATVQTLVPERMRAVSVALLYLFANLIGMGLGPLAAGALSDALRPLWGEESLRYALLALCPGYFWVAWHLWRGSRTVMQDVEVVQQSHGGALPAGSVAMHGAKVSVVT